MTMDDTKTRIRHSHRETRAALALAWAVTIAPLLLAACADSLGVAGQPCPCATGNVCCPSRRCAADLASCSASGGTLMTAPVALTFSRLSETSGDFSWGVVAGATSYVLYVDGAESKATTATTAALDIGPGNVDVQVAAKNDTGESPKSGRFPVLFDVSVRACGSDNAEVRWTTMDDTDTAFSIDRPSQDTITCFDPTPRAQHLLGDMASCAQIRLPAGTGGRLAPASTMTLNMLSRDSMGFLGRYSRPFTLPGQSCMCATSSKAGAADLCNPPDITMMPGGAMTGALPALPPCGPAFDLETGEIVTDRSRADVFMEATEDANGSLEEVSLVAPQGVSVVENTAICDILEAPTAGYTQKVVVGTATPTQSSGRFPERTTSFVVKTRNGRYAKLSLECNCPGGFLPSGIGIGAHGMRFGWRLARPGTTTFDD